MRKSHRIRFFAALAGLSVAALAFLNAGCSRPSAAATDASAAEPPAVETVGLERSTIRRSVMVPGQIEADLKTPIHARIIGHVAKRHVDIGQRVDKGQLLIEQHVPDMVEDLEHKKASEELARVEVEQAERAHATSEKMVLRAEATLKQTEAGLARAEASVFRWRAENERIRQLLPTRSVDQSTADVTTEQLKTAEAALIESRASIVVSMAARDESQARRNQAETDVKVAKAKLCVAESDRRRTAEMLDYSKIRAPFAGVVTQRNVEEGQLLQPPSGNSTSAKPLLILERLDVVRVSVEVPEASAPKVALGSAVQVRVPALKEREFSGTVTRSSKALAELGRTLRVEIDLPNPDGSMVSGMYVSARIESEHPGVFTAPASAIFIHNEQPTVVRVENGKALRTPVKLGVRHGSRVELVKKQTEIARLGEAIDWKEITGDEELIAVNPESLADGQLVRPNRRAETQQLAAGTATP